MKLQSIAPRSVLWRVIVERDPPERMLNRSSRRAAICSGVSTRTLAAASSIARGIPSSRRQISSITVEFDPSTSKEGSMAIARSRKSSTASVVIASGGTSHTLSPETPSGSRLVVRIRRNGQRRSRSSTSCAAPSITCSQLSRIRRRSSSRNTETRASVGFRSAVSRSAREAATCCATSEGSLHGESSTQFTQSTPAQIRRCASSEARRVFPLPPAPVSVSNLCEQQSVRSSSSSWLRPMRRVSEGGGPVASGA